MMKKKPHPAYVAETKDTRFAGTFEVLVPVPGRNKPAPRRRQLPVAAGGRRLAAQRRRQGHGRRNPARCGEGAQQIACGSLAAALLALVTAAHAAEPAKTYNHVRLIDGTGAPARNDMAIVVQGERIVAITPAVKPGKNVIDMHGATAMPGHDQHPCPSRDLAEPALCGGDPAPQSLCRHHRGARHGGRYARARLSRARCPHRQFPFARHLLCEPDGGAGILPRSAHGRIHAWAD